jgi:hypothetical protein
MQSIKQRLALKQHAIYRDCRLGLQKRVTFSARLGNLGRVAACQSPWRPHQRTPAWPVKRSGRDVRAQPCHLTRRQRKKKSGGGATTYITDGGESHTFQFPFLFYRIIIETNYLDETKRRFIHRHERLGTNFLSSLGLSTLNYLVGQLASHLQLHSTKSIGYVDSCHASKQFLIF